MPITDAHWKIFFTLLLSFLSFFTTPSMATSLNEVIRNSLANSIALEAARQNWIANRELIGSGTATSDVSARLTSTGSLGQSNSKTGSGFKKVQSITSGITLSKNLYDGGQSTEKTILGQINLQAASANHSKTEQLVILTSIEAYLNVLTARREIKLLKKNLTRLNAYIADAKIRVRAGAATPTRLAEAKARYVRAQSDTVFAETRLANSEDSFQSLTGLDMISFTRPILTGILPKDLKDAETIAQSEHPDILSAAAAERAANQAFNTLEASVRPILALSLSANSIDTNGSTLDKNEVAAQIIFSSPLLSTNATRSTARSVAASYEEAKLNRAEIIRKIKVAARGAFRNWKVTTIRVSAVLSEIEAIRLVARGIASETRLGQKTALELLDAEKDITNAELSLVKAEHNHFLAAFQLKAAIGNLTAKKLGLENIAGQLADLPSPQNPFQDTFPFRRNISID